MGVESRLMAWTAEIASRIVVIAKLYGVKSFSHHVQGNWRLYSFTTGYGVVNLQQGALAMG